MLVRSIGRTAAVATLLSVVATAGLTSLSATALAATKSNVAPVVTQEFFADSGDRCVYGQVRGVLGWHLPPVGGPPSAVDASGVLVDRPTGPITTPECTDDRRFSVVTLSAYSGGSVIDTEVVRADNGQQRFALTLVGEIRRAPIDMVVVYVCRHSLATGRPDYCGSRQVFRAPISI